MGILDKFTDPLSDLIGGFTGQAGAEAALEGSQLQAESGLNAILARERALQQSRQDLAPFQQVGLSSIDALQGTLGAGQAPELQNIDLRNQALGAGAFARQSLGQPTGISSDIGIGPLQSQGLDPNILNDPAFLAQQADLNRNIGRSAAASGKFGAGQRGRDIARSNLLLGNQFAQDRLNATNLAQGTRFDQLNQALGLEQGIQQRGFDQGQQALQFGLGAQGQGFAQEAAALQGLNAPLQQNFQNQQALQGINFDQLQGLTNLGQAAAAGQATQGIQTGQGIANTLGGIGNAQAAGGIGAAQAQGQGALNLGNTALGIASAFQPPPQDQRLFG